MNKKQKKNIKVLTGVLAVAGGMVIASAVSATPTYASFAADQNGKFYTDFSSFEEEQEFAGSLNVKIMEESVTLLKNKDETLPLAKGSNISLLGTHSYRPFLGGTGSGSIGGSFATLPDSLTNSGLNLNAAVSDYYKAHDYKSNVCVQGMFTQASQSVDGPASEIEALKNTFTFYGDAALITIGRIGGEGDDLLRTNVGIAGNTIVNQDPTKHSLELFDTEKDLIEVAKQYCDKVIILINSANAMEIPELEDDPDIDAIVWIGQPGETGLKGVGPVLVGDVAPSGRLADIWPADFKKDPTWFNFGDNKQNNDYDPVKKVFDTEYSNVVTQAIGSKIPNGTRYALEEEEGIYLGYKWYETAAADGILDDLAIYESANAAIPEDKAGDMYYNRSTGVVYPFGFGLSYTEFNKEFVSTADEVQAAINAAASLEASIPVKVRVTNNGSVAGKEVVQLYNHAPYTNGGIEKAEVSLAGFAKTKLLKPGRSEVVTVNVRVGDLAAFDYNDANENNFAGWEIEAGAYELRLQDNSHEQVAKLDLALTAKEFRKDGSVATGLAAGDSYNVLSKGDDYDTLLPIKLHVDGEPGSAAIPAKPGVDANEDGDYDDEGDTAPVDAVPEVPATGDGVTFKLMSRANFVTTFPTAPTAAERVYPDIVLALLTNSSTHRSGDTSILEGQANYSEWAKYYRYTGNFNGSDDLPTDPWYKTNADIPASWTQLATARASGTQAAVLIQQMSGLDFNSDRIVPEGHPYAGSTEAEAWNQFMNQLTYAELAALLQNGGYKTPGLNAIGKKQAGDQDGPAQLKGTQNGGNMVTNFNKGGTPWCCEVNISSTWNVELAHKQGLCVGNESLFNGSNGWYGPAMNTHRSPFSGRNFEYYSQDGVHGGIIAGAVVSGAQSKGCNVFMKHYALNDQETNRMQGIATYNSEQAIRETLLKPFEYATKVGHATAVMTAFNRSGSIPAFANYMFNEEILRQEWGFMGESVTDYYSASMGKGNYLQRGGCHLALNGNLNYNTNITGTRSNTNAITGIWDPELREGKGGVRDGLKVDDVIPESPTQYYAIRMAATYICWVGANSNSAQNGVTTVGATGNTTTPMNIFSFETNQSLKFGVSANINAAVNPEHVPSDCSVKYELEGTLPSGLSFNTSTGRITGSATELGTFNLTVKAIIDNYILRSASLKLTVDPTAQVNEDVYLSVRVYQAGDLWNGNANNEIKTVGNPTITGIEGAELVTLDAEAAEALGLTAGTYIKVSSNVAGLYTVRFSQSVTYYRNAQKTQTRNGTNSSNFTVMIGVPEVAPQPVVHGGIVSAVINEQGHLIITYEDKAVVDLGVVVGADGAAGAAGAQGEQGAQGPAGAAGQDGHSPVLTIGENGNWFVDGVDTGIAAQGPKGEQGAPGADGKDGKDGVDGKDGAAGAQGPQGPQGEKGETGPAGADGKDGAAAKGCGGSIAAASGIMALIAGLGLAVVAIKKNRKED